MKNRSIISLFGSIGGVFMLGMLVSVNVFAQSATDIGVDPANEIQHIDAVRVEQIGGNGFANLSSMGSGLLKIQTTSNILLGDDNTFAGGSIGSTILGGTENSIVGGKHSTIVAGTNNQINDSHGQGDTILGGVGNIITGSKFSTIAGGKHNKIAGNGSTIVGGANNEIQGNYSAIVGSGNQVIGNNSVAMGYNVKVVGNNSFLWSEEGGELTGNDIFAVLSSRGMVINASVPNQNAQMTVGGPLVVVRSDNDKNVICSGNQGIGTIKNVYSGGRYCLCSCDGNNRNSMFGHGQCQSICHSDDIGVLPTCGTGVYRYQNGSTYFFEGTCKVGNPVEGTGAYLVDSNDKVHWTCQTYDGMTIGCSGFSTVPPTFSSCNLPWGGSIPHRDSVTAYFSDNPEGPCISEIRTCDNGYLNGTYQYRTCNPGCKQPWDNTYISHGSSLTAFRSSSVPAGSNCQSINRQCSNGALNGDSNYKYQNCNVESNTNSCYYKNASYPHLSTLVTYSKDSTTCPEGCNDASVAIYSKCYNGMWLSANSAYWTSVTSGYGSLTYGGNPSTIQANPRQYTACVSHDSSNASTYTLSSCLTGLICSSATVSLAVNNVYPGNSCGGNTVKYKSEGCNPGYYRNGNGCTSCPTGYTSNTGATSQSACYIMCNDAKYLPTTGASSCESCPIGMYSIGQKVYYGNISSCSYCTNNKPDFANYTSNSTGNNCAWECGSGYKLRGNQCVAVNMVHGVFAIEGTLSICNPDNDNECLTMMNHNLGTNVAGTGTSSYGYMYQWGNNHGFPSVGSVTTQTSRVNCASYGPQNYYSGSKFVKGYQNWCNSDVSNLWGGGSDYDRISPFAYPVTNTIDRKGPCSSGYHVPSKGEWVKIIGWWISWYNKDGNNLPAGNSISNSVAVLQFQNDFLIPFVGVRNYSNSSVNQQGSYASLWASSKDSSSNAWALNLNLGTNSVSTVSVTRADGSPVRCFKNN